MFDDDNFMDDDFDVKELVNRFEKMVKQHQSCYFDADELNVILEHYLQQNNIKRANQAADIAVKYHPNNPIINIIKAKQLLANSHAQEALSTLKNADLDHIDDVVFASFKGEDDAISVTIRLVFLFVEVFGQ